MRIISRKTLVSFWSQPQHQDAELPLRAWWVLARKADWASPHDIKGQFASASVIAGNRMVFDIGGNKYRLIVKFNYAYRTGYIRFVGTHEAYDQVDAETI
ncbi:type II toxin-antitoxin system HigB family toxin [Marinihelvus fidelis]|uniref:Type II toxin-antitoxin system HigB family toxin n=1 Tax=Marinihelvus fidelis TaxID=2613842 RepID=A0A5N0T9B9_9GAMM|nr:type II toxin-antitoxin system HigB family toxin [Marinihelvus fidelis]KAA9131540.1 type II toxin-antitoxin system HigB family toxin [Marinihelvus fidelis]